MSLREWIRLSRQARLRRRVPEWSQRLLAEMVLEALAARPERVRSSAERGRAWTSLRDRAGS